MNKHLVHFHISFCKLPRLATQNTMSCSPNDKLGYWWWYIKGSCEHNNVRICSLCFADYLSEFEKGIAERDDFVFIQILELVASPHDAGFEYMLQNIVEHKRHNCLRYLLQKYDHPVKSDHFLAIVQTGDENFLRILLWERNMIDKIPRLFGCDKTPEDFVNTFKSGKIASLILHAPLHALELETIGWDPMGRKYPNRNYSNKCNRKVDCCSDCGSPNDLFWARIGADVKNPTNYLCHMCMASQYLYGAPGSVEERQYSPEVSHHKKTGSTHRYKTFWPQSAIDRAKIKWPELDWGRLEPAEKYGRECAFSNPIFVRVGCTNGSSGTSSGGGGRWPASTDEDGIDAYLSD